MNIEKRKKVFVGLSGGVDSAVSAGLLKQEGYDVTGVFIKAWSPDGYPCTWKEDRRSAMRVCAVLDIPFITLDLEKEYKKEVVDYMLKEYKEGKTPNPDVICNKEIKFGHFLKFALENGTDFVATGHYAIRYENYACPQCFAKRGGRAKNTKKYEIKESEDKEKDQTYFLWTLTEEQLKHILFPIGHLQKTEVRRLAEKFGLPQATRKDSQGLCFLGKIDMKEFLKDFIKIKRGDVLDTEGNTIGKHSGSILYTLGERHGFTIFNNKIESKPLYVVAKNVENNTITVSEKSNNDRQTIKNGIRIKNENWILKERPKGEIECRWRYRQKKVKCEVTERDGELSVSIPLLDENISSGQSIVFYLPDRQAGSSEICLGGAIIG